MKQIRHYLLLAAVILCGIMAQAQIVITYPNPFLSDEERPDGTLFLPAPPEPTDPAFCNDFYYYQWGKLQRDTPAGEKAKMDSPLELWDAFSDAFGMPVSPGLTPEIHALAGGSSRDAHLANKRAKNFFQRKRPFAYFHEPSIIPEADEERGKGYSYPSGHATRGWVYAMTLALVNPDSTNALLKRAQEYAIGRVIAGHHYKSDIDCSLMLAASIMGALNGSEAFKLQLARAREEYARLKRERQNR